MLWKKYSRERGGEGHGLTTHLFICLFIYLGLTLKREFREGLVAKMTSNQWLTEGREGTEWLTREKSSLETGKITSVKAWAGVSLVYYLNISSKEANVTRQSDEENRKG